MGRTCAVWMLMAVLGVPSITAQRAKEPLRGRVDPNLPSFTAALEEQLGLKLESRKGPVDVLAIESVSQLTEN